jgi:hypothetical protein
MREINTAKTQPRILNVLPFYYGWVIVGLSFLANLTAAGLRSAPSVLIHPLEAEFGWSRTAVALDLDPSVGTPPHTQSVAGITACPLP